MSPGTLPQSGDALDELQAALETRLGRLHDQEATRQQLLDGHSEMACLETSDGTLREVNAAYCRLFGKTRDELVGTNYLDLIPPSDRTDAVNSLRKLSRRNPVHIVEHRVILPDGSMRWTRWTNSAVFGDDDTANNVLSFGADITAEKDLADRLGALQSAFNQMQSLAQTGSLTWDFTCGRMEWTDETWRLLGLDKNTGHPSLDNLLALVTANDRESLRELFRQARDNGDPFEHEFRCVLPDGSRRTLQSRAEVRADPQTKILDQLTCTLRDITALRDAEAATKRELRFREAVEQSLASGIVASDDQGRILSVNPAFCAMTGWSGEELLGLLPPYPYWPEEEVPAIQKAFATTLGGGTPLEGYALRFCRKDGSRFDVLVNVAPLLDAEDRRLGWLGSVTDVTTLQETRRRLREANERLETARDIAALGIWSWNPETGEIQWDARSFEFYGHPGATDAGAVWRRLQPAAETARAEQNVLQAEAEGRTSGRFLISIFWPDGSEHTIESSFRRLREPGTNLTRFTGVHRDITADITRERELRTTNERLKTAQEVVEFGIWDWDPVQDKLFWDRQSFALFGRPDATDAEAVWAEVLSEEERERLTYELQRLIAAGGTSGEDLLRVEWPDGSRHEISSTYLIMRDDRGQAIRVFGVNRDITNEMETERELRDAHERLTAALEGGRFGTFEHVIGEGDYNWNLANYEMNGIDPSVTQPAELFAAWKKGTRDFFPQLLAGMAALPSSENNYTYEFTAYPDHQEPRRIRVSLFIERNKQGHPARLVGISRRLD
jgi:PAS domain S-box-containing protein